MPEARITHEEHSWQIVYQLVSINGGPGFQILKVTGALTPAEKLDKFFKALRPLWNSLELASNTSLVMTEDLIPFLAEAAPGSDSAQ